MSFATTIGVSFEVMEVFSIFISPPEQDWEKRAVIETENYVRWALDVLIGSVFSIKVSFFKVFRFY